MQFIADLHIHSHFSRATSGNSHIDGLAAWAQLKGVQVLATGDCSHPQWLNELKARLEPAEPGFFRLKDSTAPQQFAPALPQLSDPFAVRFILSTEISSIYKRQGQVRKIHNLIYVPDFSDAERLNTRLTAIGNLAADGRPMLRLDARDLLEIVLETAPDGFLVPAHIWTPWFSLFGSRSGFDTVEECFGDLSAHIFALETGLSSNPDMNRLISALDRFTLISNSDCHSPGKIGREATVFDTAFDFFALKAALQTPCDPSGHRHLKATIEFYPEHGKYFHDGHRRCAYGCDPHTSKTLSGLCPVCGKPLTIGVFSRVLALADRQTPWFPPGAPDVYSLVPLQELLGELLGIGPESKGVMKVYWRLLQQFGPELTILTETPVSALASGAVPGLAEAVHRVRQNQVLRTPGFDGQFGKIRTLGD